MIGRELSPLFYQDAQDDQILLINLQPLAGRPRLMVIDDR
jgi:hypothetical protein